MQPFTYERAGSAADGARLGKLTAHGDVHARTQFLAGGTTQVDLMKLNVLTPEVLVDLNALRQQHAKIAVDAQGVTFGAFATMAEAANNPEVARSYPVIADSLNLAASQQIRNMATLGGNLLQRTRCNYFRDVTWKSCNKRAPGSGCAALEGVNRNHAVLGVDDSCIAQYPGDFAVAMIALDAVLTLQGARGTRKLPVAQLHRPPGGQPHLEHNLEPGELIVGIHVPAGAWTPRSTYIKVRDRESYEFAIASAAVALDLDGEVVRAARIGLGGMAYRPWRATAAEQALTGQRLTRATAEQAAQAALEGAITHGHNDYKPELGRRTLVRALLTAQTMSVRS
ncbi:MAG TPA: xanthine dehydrogenase family protein subunit M [Steroidobacteraceae bacterium]|nr:xanthine dehydrogenase family protein subunit M [Steroidobacteraceae bacterium]